MHYAKSAQNGRAGTLSAFLLVRSAVNEPDPLTGKHRKRLKDDGIFALDAESTASECVDQTILKSAASTWKS